MNERHHRQLARAAPPAYRNKERQAERYEQNGRSEKREWTMYAGSGKLLKLMSGVSVILSLFFGWDLRKPCLSTITGRNHCTRVSGSLLTKARNSNSSSNSTSVIDIHSHTFSILPKHLCHPPFLTPLMSTDSTAATRSVTLEAADGSSVTVDIRNASPVTQALRKKVEHFLRRTLVIWKEQPPQDTGLIATPAVVDEVVHCATAFHANEQDTVDLVVAKKDIPMEAIKDPEVGYWLGTAGPAPRLEQREIAIIRDIPQLVMDEIAQNNNHDLIAHFLYAFINFWCIVLKHWIIWLACIFWYGYLCILKPTIIVGESSKLYNILRLLPPRAIFREDLTEEEFDAFLDGNFNMAFLRQLIVVGIEKKEWDDYALPPTDYIHSVGLPVIQAYGPFAHQWALYIPKMDPYAPYHIQSLRNQMIDCDRCVRLMIELSLQIIGEAAPIPQGASRKACLTEVRARIMQEASRLGLLSMLNDAKARLAQANKGFVGARSIAARARTTEEIAQGTRKDYTVAG